MQISGSNLDLAQKMHRLMNETYSSHGTAVSAAIFSGGEVKAAAVCGTQDGEPGHPATVDDLFNIGSVSKVYCALGVMKLVEMGLAQLDTPVCNYLPRFVMRDERYKKITLRHCLNHSSGLPGTRQKSTYSGKWLGDDYNEHCYDYFSKARLKAEPGEYSVYCNDGFVLAQMVIEELAHTEYIRFIIDHVTGPIGALSAGSNAVNPLGRTPIRESGMPREYLSVIGSGGIASDLSDCARLGYAFVRRPDGFVSQASLDEITAPQGVTFIKEDTFTPYFGLGWDTVNMTAEGYDLGEGALMKSGGTFEFSSFLLVSRKHDFSAAISCTLNSKKPALPFLIELCAMYMESRGVDIRVPKIKAEVAALPIPENWAADYAGDYTGLSGIVRFEPLETGIKVSEYSESGWKTLFECASYDGRLFNAGPYKFSFVKADGNTFFMLEIRGATPHGQKIKRFAPLSPAWEARLGKHYICVNAHPSDFVPGNMSTGLLFSRPYEDNGVIITCFKGAKMPGGITRTLYLPADDNELAFFNRTPASGSRDMFNTFVFEHEGVEHVYDRGITYVDAASFPHLESGEIVISSPEQGAGYAIREGCTLDVETDEDFRMIMIRKCDLCVHYDSMYKGERPQTCDGYVVFLNSAPVQKRVRVRSPQSN